jgi:hypothetical protein
MSKRTVRILITGLALLLSLSAFAFTAMAEDTTTPTPPPPTSTTPPTETTPAPDPVATVAEYLNSIGTDAETTAQVTTALSDAMATGNVDPAQIQELVEAMIRTKADSGILLRVTERVTLMASDGLPFGQVMKTFRLSLKEGKNNGIENALSQAEKFVRKEQERAGISAQNGQTSQTATSDEAKSGDSGKEKGSKGEGKGKSGK